MHVCQARESKSDAWMNKIFLENLQKYNLRINCNYYYHLLYNFILFFRFEFCVSFYLFFSFSKNA